MKTVKNCHIVFVMFSYLPKTAKSKIIEIINTKSSELNVEIGMGWAGIYPDHFHPYLQPSATKGNKSLEP
jgi:hypothetical protein